MNDYYQKLTVIENMRYICLDQNVLRKPVLEAETKNSEISFVLPDVAILEMAKPANWRSTVSQSLKILAKVPDRVFCTIGNGELLTIERERQRAVSSADLFNLESTEDIRGLLRETFRGKQERAYRAFDRMRTQRMKVMRKGHLNNDAHVMSIQELVPTVLNSLSEDHLKRLRRREVSQDERMHIISGMTTTIFPGVARAGGIGDAPAEVLLKQKSYIARYLWVRVRYALLWVEHGGHGSVRPERATNDALDMHYVLAGSYFDALMTQDTAERGPFAADAELRLALDPTYSWDVDINYLSRPI